jgi:HPt (histidine-containing phosphotransfer) domain-containing protein
MIDLKEALEAMEGDRALLQDCLFLLQEDMPERMAEIRAALAVGELPRVCRAAHTIKGSVAVVGATSLKQTAHALEDASRAGQVAEAHTLFSKLCSQFDELCRFLDQAEFG